MNTHIVTVGKTIGHVLTSLKQFNVDKVILISSLECKEQVDEIVRRVVIFNIETEIKNIKPFERDSYKEIVNFIIEYSIKHPREKYFINVTGGTNLMSAAAQTAAHFIGASAYYVLKNDTDDKIIEVPVIKFSLHNALTKTQKIIFKALSVEIKKHGEVRNMSKFAASNRTYKQRILHHINELEKLNLIKIDRSKREHRITFTTTGELLNKML
jgi:CRISPR/Cas system-associated protein Csm6